VKRSGGGIFAQEIGRIEQEEDHLLSETPKIKIFQVVSRRFAERPVQSWTRALVLSFCADML